MDLRALGHTTVAVSLLSSLREPSGLSLYTSEANCPHLKAAQDAVTLPCVSSPLTTHHPQALLLRMGKEKQ